jgi:hypothetical protein
VQNLNLVKGKELEDVVETIERLILKDTLGDDLKSVKIERNKIIIKNGVRYECDLYVTIDHGNGYDSVFIFECKNWKANKVSKNDILIFNDKLDVLCAQKGYFIATDYSSDAKHKAEQYSRMELLTAESKDYSFTFRMEDTELRKINYEFLECDEQRRNSGNRILPYDVLMIYRGKRVINNGGFLGALFGVMAQKILETAAPLQMGINRFTIDAQVPFQPGELLVDNEPMCCLKITGEFVIFLCEPQIELSYDISGRGRVTNMTCTLPSGQEVAMRLTSYLTKENKPN